MTRYLIHIVAFLAGLAVVGWVGAGYAGSNALALVVTLLIGGFYLAGAFELQRYRQATSTLAQALAGMSEAPADLRNWLVRLHPGLRDAVRLRIEGERVGLPGPALAPYLVGLLVLLGMLGTFLGMVSTLRGTGIALESATDLHAIRASLAAPVKGLGFAFGTSVAGVATSAMLGLLSALCRRERIEAAQALDARIATTLRPYSRGHQREEAFRLLQRQADVMPALVDRLQAMMAAMEQQSQGLTERLAASQDAFHGKTEAVYTRLASSVEQSLKDSVADSARAASTAIQPAVEATMAGLARETAAMRDAVAQAVEKHLDGLSTRFAATTASVADTWHQALAGHQRTSEALAQDLRTSLDGFARTFEQRSAGLLENVATRMDTATATASEAWTQALSRHERASEKLAADNQQALATAASAFEQHAAALVSTVGQSHAGLHAELASRDDQRLAAWADTLGTLTAALRKEWEQASAHTVSRQQEISEVLAQTAREISAQSQAHASKTIAEIDRLVQAAAEAPKAAAAMQAELAAKDEQRLAAWTASLGAMAAALRQEWEQAGAATASRQQQICEALAQTARDISTQSEAQARNTLAEIDRLVEAAAEAPKAAAALQADLAGKDEQRLAAWTESLGAMAAALRQQWEQATTHTAERQQQICETLAQTARDISTQSEAQARSTIAEVSRLVQAATEAPKAAAEVIAELRQKLTDGMARDNAMLEERSRMLETLGTLLDAVNHASTQQRTAVDTLVGTTADLLDRVGTRFTDKVEAETGKLADVAAQVTGSAVEVASLGEALGVAVQLFSESNAQLTEQLQRIEAALDKSMTRSDEQLAYYVAQAREVVDLSMLSQKQILEDLQQLGGQRAPRAEAA
ncbi:DUF802 domain-containing protein [Cupriavidus necator]|uniref:DUF802 domain-containing protein n=1 Tax=Cupriavidus necator TaxID=106590 RepID=UPI00339D618C